MSISFSETPNLRKFTRKNNVHGFSCKQVCLIVTKKHYEMLITFSRTQVNESVIDEPNTIKSQCQNAIFLNNEVES